ncbi:MetQ/NlpA family ABC transporter substrate-binding protein [Arcanobacterium ihumii]|uniref:MetQ/NlpA family ABC transporter substrate-binding protein n=1 Tax=Arcanobacterium ihumii TaxID=2138162 RepID=UPI000F548904|nr:MetQ/NlpA family ABC transporter substrate-binding protein [Arcanobacterium ihumii]
MKKKPFFALLIASALSLTACSGAGSESSSSSDSNSQGKTTHVRIGLTGTFNEDIWAPIKKELKKEGVEIETVQFANYSLPNAALEAGDIELNAFQHHAFLQNEIKSHGYHLTPIGDTYIVTMSVFSDKIHDLKELKKGDKVAIPNDATNGGRALKLLEEAGVIGVDPAKGNTPDVADITKNDLELKFVEADANLVASLIPDAKIAVVNGNYALDSKLPQDQKIYSEKHWDSNAFYLNITARTEDKDNPVYKRIVEAFQTEQAQQLFEKEFKGNLISAWDKKDGQKAGEAPKGLSAESGK